MKRCPIKNNVFRYVLGSGAVLYGFKVKVNGRSYERMGFSSRKACLEALNGFQCKDHLLTWGSLVNQWLVYVKPLVKVSTFYKYRLMASKYFSLMPLKVLVSSMDSSLFLSWFGSLDCSLNVRRRLVSMLDKVFQFCSSFCGVDNFSYRKLVVPKDYSIHQVKEDYILSIDDFRKFYSVISSSFWQCFFLLEFVTGMRIGEIRGLRFSDLDLDGCSVQVNHQATSKVGVGKTILMSPKSPSSCRVYSLPNFLVQKLNGLHGSDGYLFKGRSSKVPIGVTTVYRVMRSYQDKAGLPHFVFHSFRKSEASYLNEIGISDVSIRDWLGHSSYAVTRKYYIRDTFEHKRKVSSALEEKLGKYFK